MSTRAGGGRTDETTEFHRPVPPTRTGPPTPQRGPTTRRSPAAQPDATPVGPTAARQGAAVPPQRPAVPQRGPAPPPWPGRAAGPARPTTVPTPREPAVPAARVPTAVSAAREPVAVPTPRTPMAPTARQVVTPATPGRPATVDPSLPLPPDDDEKVAYRRRRLPVLMIASFISFSGLLTSQLLFVRMAPWLLVLLPLFGFTVLYYLISATVNIGTPGFDLDRHRRLVRDFQPPVHPSVDVFLPVCGEATEVLRNTWEHVSRMVDHYPGRVHVYVLDDSATDEREAMALAFGFVYQRRPNRGWYKKAGNMRYAYQRTLGEHILVLDADFTPRHDMLDEMVPYLAAEPDLGIVQSPQYFRVHAGQGWLERGAGAVQELFYRMVQVSRQHHEAAICVGSCALYRREALDAIGGSTLIEHSEDVHTGFDMRRRGWRLRYVPVPLATGLCPADVSSFFTQQYRWCAGSMSLLGSTKFWNTRMRLRTRLSYLSGFCYYLHTALFTFVGPLVPIVLLAWFPQSVALANYLWIVPSLIYNLVVFPLWHRCAYRVEAWTVKMVYGWSHAFAIWDLLRGQSMGWQPTGGTGRKNRTGRLWWGMAVCTAGSGALWTGLAAHRMIGDDLWTFAPAFLGGAFYLAVALQALLVKPARDIRPGRSR
ncbi:glycosyltransferase family 2 protein [Micromonospora matsumotoense]|uniref:glycosyltransferase family 2 protein n=1 Tax=Micromonospora matsumotoense TaxID=121616 RepID=UPI0033DA34D3